MAAESSLSSIAETGDTPRAEARADGSSSREAATPPSGMANGDSHSLDWAEAKLLLACVADPRGDEASPVRALLGGPIRWPLVMQWAARHRVRPLLFAGLCSAGAPDIPKVVLAELGAFAHANARRNLYLLSELLRLLDLYAAEGIDVAPFKGPVLASRIYGNPALREAGDLDLLVRRADIIRARQLLISLGHRPIFPTATPGESAWLRTLAGQREVEYLLSHSEHHLLREEGLLNIDLHWALAVRDFHLCLDEQSLWSWLPRESFAGRDIRTFAAEELLLVLCINGAKDCWERLDRISDVGALLRRFPDLDAARLFDKAAAFGAARMLRVGLLLAGELLHAPISPAMRIHIARDPAGMTLVQRIRDDLFSPRTSAAESSSLARSLLHVRLRERLSDRIGYCLEHLSPGVGDWAALPIPRPLAFLHYLTRPLRLLGRYAMRSQKMP
jgi:hypothetical protein